MNVHETYEALSAYLDDEVSNEERARIEAHLKICSECPARKSLLEGVAQAVAALPEVAPASAESRALRLAVIERGPKPRPFTARAWALLGGVAIVVVGIAGYGLLTRNRQPAGVVAGKALQEAPAPPLVFGSEQDVRNTVRSLAEIDEGARRYTVSDVGTKQSKVLASFETSGEAAVVADSSQSSSAEGSGTSRQAQQPAPETAAAAPEVPLATCIRSILRSQPYPMMPVAVRAATFKDSPVWMLAYAWTNSKEPQARLDRIQVWLVDRTTCSADAPLFYAAFKP